MLTIAAAALAFRQQERTPVELVRDCLAAIERREAEVHAWVRVESEQARVDAERLTRELAEGHDRGPLHGIPLGVKDIFDVADWPTAAGSRLWANAIARADATVISRLREAGAIFLGKTVTTAFASFDPPITRNPWDRTRTPGGSSSGSAAALACEMCLGALGSQTGGSLTRPASYCGVAACKPTYGLLPIDGIVPLAPSLDHPGPMARCVGDLHLMLEAMAGPSLPASRNLPWRLGRPRGLFESLAEPGVNEAIDDVAVRLREERIEVVDFELPTAFDDVLDRHLTIMAYEAAQWHRERLQRYPDDYPPRISGLIERGLACSTSTYADCRTHQRQLSNEMDRRLRDVPFLLTPATTGVAPLADTTGSPAFNSPWSYTGLPTVSFPVGRLDGLPFAVQLVGPRGADADVLMLAERCEAICCLPSPSPPVLRGRRPG